MKRIIAFAALLALPLVTAAAPVTDWTRHVTVSPIGGYVMGNPAAKTRVIEYVSYTCHVCAALTNEGGEPLKTGWVRGGTVNLEVRNLVRDAFDMTAALLARCGGPTKFYGNHMALFADFTDWTGNLRNYDAIAPTLEGKSREETFAAIADTTGLFALMQKRGFTRPQLVACIGDKAEQARILAMTDEATDKVMLTGTPGILLNGRLLDTTEWDGLKAALPPGASQTRTLRKP